MAYDDSKNMALMDICEKPSKNKSGSSSSTELFPPLGNFSVLFLKWDVLTASGQHLGTEMHISTALLECTCLPAA